MKKQGLSILFALCASTSVFAANANVSISGVVPGYVAINQPAVANGQHMLKAAPVAKKYIEFERIVLSPEAEKYLAEHVDAEGKMKLMALRSSGVPQAQLGMNNVPVLDQGQHGTCATFATTAALDAVLGHSDHISQLCNLELGAYLESKNSGYPSGWDGSTNDIILKQVQQYGVISQDYQKKSGCSGVRVYPAGNPRSTGRAMTADDFTRHSEKVMTNISWRTLLDMDNAFSTSAKMDDVIGSVKQAIAGGHRIVFGMLVDENIGGNGTAGTYKVDGDSWVLTPQIAKDAKAKNIHAGHAMVITGYDDDAVITDTNGKKHKGVFTLRNSWGESAGDNGTYYLSYDYFTSLVLEVKEIIPSA